MCMCMLRGGGNYCYTAQLFIIFFPRDCNQPNQLSNARDLKQAERLKAPGNLTETRRALGSTAIFSIHFGERDRLVGGCWNE